jgi:membrane protease YdiL (CAAX protease family)
VGDVQRRAPDPVDAVRVLGSGVLVVALLLAATSGRGLPEWLTVLLLPAAFLVVPLVYAAVCRIRWVDGFAFRLPPASSWIFIALASVSSMWLLTLVFKVQDWVLRSLDLGDYARQTEQQLQEMVLSWFRKYGFFKTLLLASVAPALTEEVFFRGIVLQGFRRRLTPVVTLVVTGAIFSVMHIYPIKFVPIFLLGAFFGALILLTRSLWAGVFAHFANNAAVLVIAQLEMKGYANLSQGAWYLYPASALLFVGAMKWLYDHRPAGTPPSA